MIEIFTLGGLEIRLEGRPIARLATHKAGALLCYLGVTGRTHSRAALAGLLWGEATEANARAYLRQALGRLRQDVAPYLTLTRDAVAFDRAAPHWVDVAAFEGKLRQAPLRGAQDVAALEAALVLYRGDFLSGFHTRSAPAFEEWVLLERERLRLFALRALYTLADHHVARGDDPRAIDYARRLLALEPADERVHRLLMSLLAQGGQRAAALHQYEALQQALTDQLGVEPDPATTALYERIRAARRAERPARRHNLPVPLTPLFGREGELAAVRQRLEDPGCRLLTLVGPGGVGKTRLALEAAAEQVDRFHDGVCYLPLGPVDAAAGMAPALAHALGFLFYQEAEPLEQLLDYVRGKQLLLVLDGFEHLLPPLSSPPVGGDRGGEGGDRPGHRDLAGRLRC